MKSNCLSKFTDEMITRSTTRNEYSDGSWDETVEETFLGGSSIVEFKNSDGDWELTCYDKEGNILRSTNELKEERNYYKDGIHLSHYEKDLEAGVDFEWSKSYDQKGRLISYKDSNGVYKEFKYEDAK